MKIPQQAADVGLHHALFIAIGAVGLVHFDPIQVIGRDFLDCVAGFGGAAQALL